MATVDRFFSPAQLYPYGGGGGGKTASEIDGYREYMRRDEQRRREQTQQLQRELENKILMDSQELFPREPSPYQPTEPTINKVLLLL